MSNKTYPKGYRQNKTVPVELELWTKFKRHVQSKGQTMTFVLMNLIRDYLKLESEQKAKPVYANVGEEK